MNKKYFKTKWDLPGGDTITILIDPHWDDLEVSKEGNLVSQQPTYVSMLKVDGLIFRNVGMIEFNNKGLCFTATSQAVGELHYQDIRSSYNKWIYATRRNAYSVSLEELETSIFKHLIKK